MRENKILQHSSFTFNYSYDLLIRSKIVVVLEIFMSIFI
jgi:hypothetical protein